MSMTESEALCMLKAKLMCMSLEDLACIGKGCDKDCDNCNYCYEQGNRGQSKEALAIAIKSLEEVRQLHAIGTVSEFRKLKEKATAKKPIPLDKYGEYHECPTCGCGAENYLGCRYKYCPNCGTEFDWSKGKE